MKESKRQSYSKEFKINAVKQVIEAGRKASEVARELGISDNLLHVWKRKYQDNQAESFTGQGNRSSKVEQIRKLEQEVKRLKDERDILKKAAIFFAQEE